MPIILLVYLVMTNLTKLLENAGVKRGDKVWLDDIEMEMG